MRLLRIEKVRKRIRIMETHHSNVAGSIEVVMLYPDGHARERVLSVFECIRDKLSSAFQISISGGKFDHLEDPMVRHYLAEIMAKADIICIAAHSHKAIPETVTRWMAQISYPNAHRPLLAIVNFSNPSADAGTSHSKVFLEAFARGHDMDFLEYHMTDSSLPALRRHEDSRAALQWLRRYPGEMSSLNE